MELDCTDRAGWVSPGCAGQGRETVSDRNDESRNHRKPLLSLDRFDSQGYRTAHIADESSPYRRTTVENKCLSKARKCFAVADFLFFFASFDIKCVRFHFDVIFEVQRMKKRALKMSRRCIIKRPAI